VTAIRGQRTSFQATVDLGDAQVAGGTTVAEGARGGRARDARRGRPGYIRQSWCQVESAPTPSRATLTSIR
jgi:hypothetical protein